VALKLNLLADVQAGLRACIMIPRESRVQACIQILIAAGPFSSSCYTRGSLADERPQRGISISHLRF
jgi:hypothetical protein